MTYVFDTLDPAVFDAVGIGGFGLYVLNYTLLTFRKLQAEHILYFVLNGMAAAMLLIGLSTAFNLASALIQIFWICISCLAVILRLRSKKTNMQLVGLR
ncbi:hypothetical protein [Yoonia sp. BS5-3]|uniref:CBU-0592-like domain-containing protein n=1 Tax=Yoonia phaeophyticola TaxID=3137369 RepID=A0ABZ2V082_9RHOB